MVKIMTLFPSLDRDSDLSFLSDKESKDFAMSFHSQTSGKFENLKDRFPKTQPELVEILESML
jgi:hypothetical protein